MQQPSDPIQANIRKYYLFHLFLNLQLWWPIWIIYLTEERGLTLAQVTLIDVPFWLCVIFLQVPGEAPEPVDLAQDVRRTGHLCAPTD